MLSSFNTIRDGLKNLETDTNSNWGKMNSNLMLIHCNNFIDVSMGRKKVSFFTRTMGRIFGKVYLKYFEYIKFDIKKYPKNSKTLNEFIPTQSEKSFIDNKNILINNLHKVEKMNSKKFKHSIYGIIETEFFQKLVRFHTSYHLYQFGINGKI